MIELDYKDIKDIYRKYFELLDSYLGAIGHYLEEDEDSHTRLGHYVSRYPYISDLILDASETLFEDVRVFWNNHASSLISFVQKQQTLKCLYSGDLSPGSLERFVKKSALYIDTIVLPDPILNITLMNQKVSLQRAEYLRLLVSHFYNVRKLQELILADVPVIPVLLVPLNFELLENAAREELQLVARNAFLSNQQQLFKKEFLDISELTAFLNSADMPEALFGLIKDENALPFGLRELHSFSAFMQEFGSALGKTSMKVTSFGEMYARYTYGQFLRVQEHKYFCQRYRAEPIYDYDQAWFFYAYDAGGANIDSAIMNALQQVRFNWISRVPLQALKILREEGALENMRGLLRRGITDLKSKEDKSLLNIGSQLEKNLFDEFRRQDSEVSSLQARVKKIVRKEIPIVAGGAIAGFIPYLGSVISLLSAGRDISKFLSEHEQSRKTASQLQEGPIGLLLKAHDEE